MVDLTPNYSEKILHIGLRNPSKRIGNDEENGLIYNPTCIYSKKNELSERIYEDFFAAGSEVIVFPVRTEQGPVELVKMLTKDFNVYHNLLIGGIVALFRATPEQAVRIMQDLKENPKRYFVSEEKKIFGDKTYVF